MKAVWTPLESFLHFEFKNWNLAQQKWLVAFSGGLDSSVLVHLLVRLQSAHKYHLALGHIHHGSKEGNKERDLAQKFCEQRAERWGVPFFTRTSERYLISEADCRDFRFRSLEEIRRSQHYDAILLAHHQQDLLETRLIRLIRGTGGQGLQSMSFKQGFLIRPLLLVSHKQLLEYQKHFQIPFISDPSNESDQYLRNWVRNKWLPELEEKHPGGVESLSRSLDLLANQLKLQDISSLSEVTFAEGIQWSLFLRLHREDKKQLIAAYLHFLKIKSFTHAQILEIIKHLDKSRSRHTFHVAQCLWQVNAEQIIATPSPQKSPKV